MELSLWNAIVSSGTVSRIQDRFKFLATIMVFMDPKTSLSEGLLEFLKENQKTVSHLLKMSAPSNDQYSQNRQPQESQPAKQVGGEALLEFLKENQKTVSHVLKLSSMENEYTYPKQQENFRQASSGISVEVVLEKMSELIELNKVTLQTIDLLDKRVKRMHTFMSSQPPKEASPAVNESREAQDEGEKVEYTG